MPYEQELKELESWAKKLTAVGDAGEAIKRNKDEFMHLWTKVMQYYRFIERGSKNVDEAFLKALDIVDDMRYDNPSLDEWVDSIIDPKTNQKQAPKEEDFDVVSLADEIESYVDELDEMVGWDPENVGNIEWHLNQCQKKLDEHKNAIDSDLYANLTDEMKDSLAKIERFKNTLNSDAMAQAMSDFKI